MMSGGKRWRLKEMGFMHLSLSGETPQVESI